MRFRPTLLICKYALCSALPSQALCTPILKLQRNYARRELKQSKFHLWFFLEEMVG